MFNQSAIKSKAIDVFRLNILLAPKFVKWGYDAARADRTLLRKLMVLPLLMVPFTGEVPSLAREQKQNLSLSIRMMETGKWFGLLKLVYWFVGIGTVVGYLETRGSLLLAWIATFAKSGKELPLLQSQQHFNAYDETKTDLPDSQSLSSEDIGLAAADGLSSFILRQAAGRIIGMAANITLARLLAPKDYGIYAIALFWSSIVRSITEPGLGASLVQQAETPSDHDKKVVFTAQLIFCGIPTLILFFAAPTIAAMYSLPQSDEWMIRVVSVCALIPVFTTVSCAQLAESCVFRIQQRCKPLS